MASACMTLTSTPGFLFWLTASWWVWTLFLVGPILGDWAGTDPEGLRLIGRTEITGLMG